mmetsp:Transcript_9317/g.12355  ORF Transcript_9317/g.12355 Transcript_9317/m.12355 type:complete len:168 (+) Transcript_9317:74-577(+)|eukprot:CAMPEP_0198147740 /NCGR_PEP_ID=MMETSP1443-20131203/37554_1 /TAXON_ID=186043 /ORGANISM="Entomoneis sp., Strain CCMP2396" /LENGTH=167 /DNA_ID=CAMNT_0043812201 /DNA_START=63 /DNA_END=566 /DNA_ORIENTATION=+
MASRDSFPPPGPADAEFTTNEEDQREAAKLRERLEQNRGQSRTDGSEGSSFLPKVPPVQIDEGQHKYVLIQAQRKMQEAEYFVISRRGASYHRNAAEPLIQQLEKAGYDDIRVKGGGRISRDDKSREISVYGYSYSFGQPDHGISRSAILGDPRFKDFHVTTSNEGY